MNLKMRHIKVKNGERKLKYIPKNWTYDFQQYETIRSFGESIYTRKASIVDDFFFYLGFFSRTFTIHRTAEEG